MADPTDPAPPADPSDTRGDDGGDLDEVGFPIGPDEVTGHGLFDRSGPERTGERTATGGRADAPAPSRRTPLLAWLAADPPAAPARDPAEVTHPNPDAPGSVAEPSEDTLERLRAELRRLWAEESPDPLPPPDALGPADFDQARRSTGAGPIAGATQPLATAGRPSPPQDAPTEEVALDEAEGSPPTPADAATGRRGTTTTLPLTPFLPPPPIVPPAPPRASAAPSRPPDDVATAGPASTPTWAAVPPPGGEPSVTMPLPPDILAAARAASKPPEPRPTITPDPPAAASPAPPAAASPSPAPIRGLDVLLLVTVASLVAAYLLFGPR